MADQRQPFRFRLPWLAPQRPVGQQTQRSRPTSEASRAPSQPTPSVPVSQPVFRPAGRAPTQPAASQPQPPPKVEAQSSSPSPYYTVIESPKETSSVSTAKPPTSSIPTAELQTPSRAATESPKETSSASVAKPQTPSQTATELPKETPSIPTAKTQTSSASVAKSQTTTELPKETPSVPTAKTQTSSASVAKPQTPSQTTTEFPKETLPVPTAKTQTSSTPIGKTQTSFPATIGSPKETPFSPTAKPQTPTPLVESRKETPSSPISKPQTPSRPNESPKEKPSRLVTESTKTISQSTSPSAANAAVKPPSPSSSATKSPKVTQPATIGKTQSTIESPKAISQPTSSAPSANTTVKPQSPSLETIEASKATPQSTSSPSNEIATTKPPFPSLVTSKSQVSSKPVSPPQTRTQGSTASVSSSPSQRDTKSKGSVVSPSQSRATSQSQPKLGNASQSQSPTSQHARIANLEVSSPTGKATQQKPKVGTVSLSPSSHDKSQVKTQAQLSAHEQESEKQATSKLEQREPESKDKITSDTEMIKTAQDVPVAKKHEEVPMPMVTARPLSTEAVEVAAPSQKSNLKPLPESEKLERLKKAVELPKEERLAKAVYEEPIQKTISEHVAPPISEKDTKDISNVAFQAPKRQQKRETSDANETIGTASYVAKHIKTSTEEALTTKEEVPLQKEIRDDISKLVQKLTTRSQVDEKSVSVITLTGENRGATMHMNSEPVKKEASVHIHRGYKANPYESPETETATDGEASSRGGRHIDQMKRETPSPKAYVNSNVQSVNNSIVFHASIEERNPGVHLTNSQNTTEEVKSIGKSESIQTRKAEFTVTPAEKLTHEPNVKRRCLRGLFMESSDSDPDNPEKPRRHGCRYKCGEKNIGEEF